jgi:hypothetical protein
VVAAVSLPPPTASYREEVAITSVTRRALAADIVARGYAWCGAIDEPDFLCRLYPLDTMPSTDSRYDNALADLVQHRVANTDWDDDWVFTDDRLGLGGGDDAALLRFLAETVHPEVRPSQDEVQALVRSTTTIFATTVGSSIRSGPSRDVPSSAGGASGLRS